MEKFDYKEAIAELERTAAAAEDPSTGIDDIDKYLKRSKELISACRAYLRSARDKAELLDEI
ncbi:MAG: exodeoxyribonuclease VII small subunit [Candidatus Cryptobacteroides sp.]|nr:exodeoxyribonuclease VII small subunit [Bacteroidales bacterium]